MHTAAVSEAVLKGAGVKLGKARRQKSLVEYNAAAWAQVQGRTAERAPPVSTCDSPLAAQKRRVFALQGRTDAAQIDLEQNAIGS